MTDRRLKAVSFFIALLLLAVVCALVERMVIHKNRYNNARYTDQAFVDLMGKLIAEHVIIKEGEAIVIKESLLCSQIRNERTRNRVRGALPAVYSKNGALHFASQTVSIVNSRPVDGKTVVRGAFLDRNGVVLAKSVVDERTWKSRRSYHYGPQFFNVIGHDSPVFGKRNLERALDDYLTGTLHPPVLSNSSDPLKRLEAGDDIVLTLNAKVQKQAYQLLGGMRGAVVVMDVATSEIIIMVSTPSFDPNTAGKDAWDKAVADKTNMPFENRAMTKLYPPGSTFKTIVAAEWLEQNKQPEAFTQFCTGKKNNLGISDIHSHGTVALTHAYAESCNLYFSQAGVMLGNKTLDRAQKFGFNRPWNLLPQLEGHEFESTASKAFQNGRGKDFIVRDFDRNPKLVAQGAIGQNLVMATPLQMAMVAATVANGGVLKKPYLVKVVRDANGKQLVSTRPDGGTRVLQETTAARMRALMVLVMERGTGKDVKKARGIKVAGKTGTAETGIDGEAPHSWFIGFAPADRPRYAISVVAENQGFGSLTAAPIAVDVLEALNTSR